VSAVAAVERVLVVDDDAPVRRMLERALGAEGFAVRAAADGGAALALAEQEVPDVVVLDVAMPGMDGLDVCRRMRAKGMRSGILMLTARDAVPDRVSGLEAGADDYLVKPFALEELVARIRALVRRGNGTAGHAGDRIAYADVTLDRDTGVAVRGGREIELTPREAELLALLMAQPRQVLTREAAIAQIWDAAAVPNVVDRYVAHLRRKLGEPHLIHTVRGIGFMLRG
jgi:two-component system, OmpR family, response regulator MprA